MKELLLVIGFLLFVIIIHFLQKRKYVLAPSGKKDGLLFGINVVAFILLIFYFVVTLLMFLDMRRYPAKGSWNILILFFTCPGLLVQLSSLIYSVSRKKLPSRFFLRRVMLTILGMMLAALIMVKSQDIAMQRFSAATEPLVQYINKSMPAPCEPVYTYLLSNRPDTFFNMSALYYNEHEFLLLYPGGSVDIDGSTVYFHSKSGKWEIIHNDDPEKPGIYILGDKLEKCKPTGEAL